MFEGFYRLTDDYLSDAKRDLEKEKVEIEEQFFDQLGKVEEELALVRG